MVFRGKQKEQIEEVPKRRIYPLGQIWSATANRLSETQWVIDLLNSDSLPAMALIESIEIHTTNLTLSDYAVRPLNPLAPMVSHPEHPVKLLFEAKSDSDDLESLDPQLQDIGVMFSLKSMQYYNFPNRVFARLPLEIGDPTSPSPVA